MSAITQAPPLWRKVCERSLCTTRVRLFFYCNRPLRELSGLEAKQYAKDGRFEALTRRVRARHAAALQKQLTEGNIDPQRTNENQFIGDYKEKLTEVKAKLVAERTKHQKGQSR